MSDKRCPWCSREMHLDAVKTVTEYENSSLRAGVYHVLHCAACRRTLHQLQKEEEREKIEN